MTENKETPSSINSEVDLSEYAEEEKLVLIDMLAHYRGEILPEERPQKVIKFAQKQLKEKERENLRIKEDDLAPQLKPYEDRISEVEKHISFICDEFNEKIDNLRAEKRNRIDKIRRDKLAEILKEYNQYRESLGLKPRTMFSKKIKVGEKKHRYDYEFKDNNNMVLIIDGKHKEMIDISNKVRVRTISNIFNKYGIKDETGGRARGVVTQVKLRKAKIKAAENQEETISNINEYTGKEE